MIQAAQDRRLAQLLRLAPMRAAIDERLNRLREQLASRAIGPQLAELRNSFERIASAEADRALAEELQDLDPHHQDQVRRVIETLAHRLAHVPLAGMRAAAPHANSETLDAFSARRGCSARPDPFLRPPNSAPAVTVSGDREWRGEGAYSRIHRENILMTTTSLSQVDSRKGNPLPVESPTQSIALFDRARRVIPAG